MKFRVAFNSVLLTGIFVVLFSFAMFQGGFVSWFLFYSYTPIFLYYIGLLLYPINRWKIYRQLSHSTIQAGGKVILNITVKRTLPFPIIYSIFEQRIPKSLHKKDTQLNKYEHFHDPSPIRYYRQARKVIFPWFRRIINLSFEFPYVPRGEHEFEGVTVRTGDLFGFVKKDYTFELSDQLIVYPAERIVYLKERLSNFHGGSMSSYILNLKNTNVATGVREYVAGDKFSWIDWKQTARQQQIMTKEFEQEKSTDKIVLFDGTYHANMNPIAFEGTVELTMSLMDEIIKRDGHVGMVSLGEEIVRFSLHDTLQKREQIRRHLTRIYPAGKKPLSVQVKEELLQMGSHYIFILVTTMLNEEVVRSIQQLQTRSAKIIIIYVQAEKLITRQDRQIMQSMQYQNVTICLLTELQLKNDPIEVKV